MSAHHISPSFPIRPHIDHRALLEWIAELEGRLAAITEGTTVAGAIRNLIAINPSMTNEAIWKIVQPAFKLPDSKRHYPGWYRSEMRRKNKLS